jgi:hypothetical protein
MRSSLKLDQHHNAAIRAEMGDRLRIILLSRELPKLPARVQHLLDHLGRLDDEIEAENSPPIAPFRVVPPKMKASLRRRDKRGR